MKNYEASCLNYQRQVLEREENTKKMREELTLVRQKVKKLDAAEYAKEEATEALQKAHSQLDKAEGNVKKLIEELTLGRYIVFSNSDFTSSMHWKTNLFKLIRGY